MLMLQQNESGGNTHASIHPKTLPQKMHAGANGAALSPDACRARGEEAGSRLAKNRDAVPEGALEEFSKESISILRASWIKERKYV